MTRSLTNGQASSSFILILELPTLLIQYFNSLKNNLFTAVEDDEDSPDPHQVNDLNRSVAPAVLSGPAAEATAAGEAAP